MLNNLRVLFIISSIDPLNAKDDLTITKQLTNSFRKKRTNELKYSVNKDTTRINLSEVIPGVGTYNPEKLKILKQQPRIIIPQAKRFITTERTIGNM